MNKKDIFGLILDKLNKNSKNILEFQQVFAEPIVKDPVATKPKETSNRPAPSLPKTPRAKPNAPKREPTLPGITVVDDTPKTTNTPAIPTSSEQQSKPRVQTEKLPGSGQLPNQFNSVLDTVLDPNMVMGTTPSPAEVVKQGGAVQHGGSYLDPVPEIYRTAQVVDRDEVSFDPNYFIGRAETQQKKERKATLDKIPELPVVARRRSSPQTSDQISLSVPITSTGVDTGSVTKTQTKTETQTKTKPQPQLAKTSKIGKLLQIGKQIGRQVLRQLSKQKTTQRRPDGEEPKAPKGKEPILKQPRRGNLIGIGTSFRGIETPDWLSAPGSYFTASKNYTLSGSDVNPYISQIMRSRRNYDEDET